MVGAIESSQSVRANAARAAVDAVRREGIELCVRLVFRVSRGELRRAGIATPVALYDELKRVFWNTDEGVVLGDHFSVGFGKVDRRRQVLTFAECHADEPRSVVAKSYEHEYGFSAGIAAIWLDLFVESSDVSVGEWLGVRKTTDGDTSAATCASDMEEAQVSASEASDNGDREVAVLGDFLARELSGGICDAGLVRQRFAFEFSDGRAGAFNRIIEGAGYYEDHGLLFRGGDTPKGHFTRLLSAYSSFAKGDAGFENAVWQHPAFRYVLRQALEEHRVLVYEGDSYISFTRLHDVLGACMADIESFAPMVSINAPEGEPFTAASLRADGDFVHPLYGLDMPDDFYEGLLNASGLLRSCTLAGAKVFIAGGEGRLSASDVVEWFVAHHEGVERDELLRLLARELGIVCPVPLLTTIVHNSGVYYDDIGDAYYSSVEAWKKEARNELA